jgi:hypothetical protein
MHRVIQHFPRPRVAAPAEAVEAALELPEVAARLEGLGTVALAVGSRGIAHVAEIVSALVAALRRRGLEVFIVPAMGSHGGATPEGQEAVLAHLGITAATVGAPIRSAMDVVQIGTAPSPHGFDIPVVMDAIAWNEADAVIPVNRIKPHTGFRGPVESGLCKMLAIGLGKHAGARNLHGEGYEVFDRLVHDVGRVIVATERVAVGLGILENAYGDIARIEAVPGDRIPDREPELLDEARRLMPRLLMPEVDVLVVEEFGKDISGVGMDANVTGRGETGGALPRFDGPIIRRIVVLSLTEAAGGNAHGIGLADLITQRAFDQIDRNATWVNSLTAGSLAAGHIPIALPTEKEAIEAATHAVPGTKPEAARIVRIRNTLHLSEIAVSDTLAETCRSIPGCEVVGTWDGTWRV